MRPCVTTALLMVASAGHAFSQIVRLPRQMESLDRGVVALHYEQDRVWIGWRLLGTEPADLAFNVYRATGDTEPVKLTPQPLAGPTNYVDASADLTKANTYSVRAVLGRDEQPAGNGFVVPANVEPRPYLSVSLQTRDGYTPNDGSVADLDGDGQYDIVLKQEMRAKDNSQSGQTDPVLFEAYKLDGTLLWRIDLGINIRAGAHYTQFMIYDLDGDGSAEVVCKTADGTTDGRGVVIGDAHADHRNLDGRILRGPEFLTVFSGTTGAALATVPYEPARHLETSDPTPDQLEKMWGDGYGNRNDRFLACVAYLDGVHPSVVFTRGYYTRTFLTAYDFKSGRLTKRWLFDSGSGPESNRAFGGQGNHNLSVADVDADGRDEIIFGGCVIDDDGSGLVSTRLGHGDAVHVSDLDPTRPGLEVARIQERVDDAGLHVYDPKTGQVLWRKPTIETTPGKKAEGPGRGVAFDVDPRYPGAEVWAAGGGVRGMFDIKGNPISPKTPSVNMAVWWDGDDLRELLDGTSITKWDWENQSVTPLLNAKDFGCVSNNGTKANPVLSADILGDWREEVIWRSADNKELRVFTTTIPTNRRTYTLMHDPVYRLGIAWQNVGYNQPPHTSFFFGDGMKTPPRPNIMLGRNTAKRQQ